VVARPEFARPDPMSGILITGSTGHTGSAAMARLQGRGVAVTAAHTEATRPPAAGPGITPVVCDYRDPQQLLRALQGIERVYLMIPFGHDMIEWGQRFVDAAVMSGVRFIVRLSALGAAPDSPSAMGRLHAQIDRSVIDSGIDFCILRGNSFMQNFSGHYAPMIRRGQLRLPHGDAQFSFIDTRDIGAAVAEILLAPQLWRGQTLDLHGPQRLTNQDAIGIISRQCGRTLEYVPITDEQAARQLGRAHIGEWEQAVFRSLDACFRAGFAAGDPDQLEWLLARPATSFEQFANDYREHWM
jgi:uncharacterized protein YbjT (DUF2867 family)